MPLQFIGRAEMVPQPIRILQVGSTDAKGGAARVALNLLEGYRARGCTSLLAVGRKTSSDPGVLLLPDDDRGVYRASGYAAMRRGLQRLATRFPGRGAGRAGRTLRL